jgi:hypothetical protein
MPGIESTGGGWEQHPAAGMGHDDRSVSAAGLLDDYTGVAIGIAV